MDDMFVQGHGARVLIKDLPLLEIFNAVGGKLIVKELPFYPPIDCTQDGCDEFAEFFALLVVTGEIGQEVSCTLCKEHMNTLIELQELGIPVQIVH